jgi:hypothetical protein
VVRHNRPTQRNSPLRLTSKPQHPHNPPAPSMNPHRPLSPNLWSPDSVVDYSSDQQHHKQQAPPNRLHQPPHPPGRPHLNTPQEISSPPGDAASADRAASKNQSS